MFLLVLLAGISAVIAGCVINHKLPPATPTPAVHHINLTEALWAEYKKIEAPLWEALDLNSSSTNEGRILLIINDTNGGLAEGLKRMYENDTNYTLMVVNYSELKDPLKSAVERVLAWYGIPFDLPIVIIVKPPILYIGSGKSITPPPKEFLPLFEKYHPVNLFKSEGYSVAIVVNNEKFLNDSLDLMSLLEGVGIRCMVYYKYLSSSAPYVSVLDNIIRKEGYDYKEYVVIANNGTLENVLPLDKGLDFLRDLYAKMKEKEQEVARKYENITVYFFYSPYCPHCHEIMPYIDSLKRNYTSVNWVYCDVTNNTCKNIISQFNIEFVPTVVVVGDGKPLIKLVGTEDIRILDDYLKALIEK